MNNPLNKKFNSYVSVDTAPYGSSCKGEDCSEPALHYYLVTGGILHGQSEFFCGSCGEKFIDHVECLSKEARIARMREGRNDWVYSIHDETRCERAAREVIQAPVGHDEEIGTWEEYELWRCGRYAQ